jgi:hypothetical protein
LRRVREIARLISRSGIAVLVAIEGEAEPDSDVQIKDAASDVGDWII